MLNSVVLPAPFGPRMPSTSPRRTSKLTSCRTRTAPKDFDTPRAVSRISLSIDPSASLLMSPGDRLDRLLRREELIDRVVDDLQVVGPFLALHPLAAEDRRLADVLVRRTVELDMADQRLQIGGDQRVAVGRPVERIGGALQYV